MWHRHVRGQFVYALTKPKENVFEKLLTVSNPGGFVQTKVHQKANEYWIELIGNATVTHLITVGEAELHQKCLDFSKFKTTATKEDAAYHHFIASQLN